MRYYVLQYPIYVLCSHFPWICLDFPGGSGPEGGAVYAFHPGELGTCFVHVARAGYEDICASVSFCLVWNMVQISLELYNIGE